MQVMVFFSIHPIGHGPHVGDAVHQAIGIIQESGLEHDVGPSGTTLLGRWDDVFAVLRRCHEALGEDGARVSSLVKIDQKPGLGPGDIRRKVDRVS
jgi:uncharacterized protein (TIGR00106 family)